MGNFLFQARRRILAVVDAADHFAILYPVRSHSIVAAAGFLLGVVVAFGV